MNKYKKALETLCEAITHRKNFVIKLAIGNLNELVEKDTPNKVQYGYFNNKLVNYHCPNCGEAQGFKVNKRWRKFCPHCGQALDWSKEDD